MKGQETVSVYSGEAGNVLAFDDGDWIEHFQNAVKDGLFGVLVSYE